MFKGARRHLVEAGMGYGAHLGRAWRIGSRLAIAGIACVVHGFLPGLFKDKASRTIISLNEEIAAGPQHAAPPVLLEFEI